MAEYQVKFVSCPDCVGFGLAEIFTVGRFVVVPLTVTVKFWEVDWPDEFLQVRVITRLLGEVLFGEIVYVPLVPRVTSKPVAVNLQELAFVELQVSGMAPPCCTVVTEEVKELIVGKFVVGLLTRTCKFIVIG